MRHQASKTHMSSWTRIPHEHVENCSEHIIPHLWMLANIVPIPKPNKDIDTGTSYRTISLLSVNAKTLEKSLLPYITAKTPTHHGYKTQHSTLTALHTVNNTIAKGFNQMVPIARTIIVSLDMSKAFDTIKRHTFIRKLIQTYIPGTIIKFIVYYIKGPKTYTTYRNNTSSQRQFNTGVPQGGVLSPTLCNIYTANVRPPRAPFQPMAYTDDITIISTHTSTCSAKKYLQPYLHKVIAWITPNNRTLNPAKTTCTLFTPDPAKYMSNLDLIIKKHCNTHGNASKGSGPYLRPKTHIHHTHSQHLITNTDATTNDKSTPRNRRRHS